MILLKQLWQMTSTAPLLLSQRLQGLRWSWQRRTCTHLPLKALFRDAVQSDPGCGCSPGSRVPAGPCSVHCQHQQRAELGQLRPAHFPSLSQNRTSPAQAQCLCLLLLQLTHPHLCCQKSSAGILLKCNRNGISSASTSPLTGQPLILYGSASESCLHLLLY